MNEEAPENWKKFVKETQDLAGKAYFGYIGKDNSGEYPPIVKWWALIEEQKQKIYAVHKEETYKVYAGFHIMIGSSPRYAWTPETDFEGDLSIKAFYKNIVDALDRNEIVEPKEMPMTFWKYRRPAAEETETVPEEKTTTFEEPLPAPAREPAAKRLGKKVPSFLKRLWPK